jgi:acid phosphatase
MYKIIIATILSLVMLFNATDGFAKEPKNLSLIKNNLIQYHDSGEYEKDQAKIIDQAMEYLKTRLAQLKKSSSDKNKKFAIILDIDETSLSNYPDLLAMDFGGSAKEIDEAEGKGTDPVIRPTLKLYRYAKENNISIFFITGRTENFRSITEKNLDHAGFKNWDGLILKPENYKEKTAAIYKIQARQQIEKQGYDIILNIGDQQSDLIGGHADKTFKLPNPYYLIP